MKLAIALALLTSTTFAATQTTEQPIPADPVHLDSGDVSGTLLPLGVRAYLGVPFADPPVDRLRWRPPEPAPKWKGVLHAEKFAPECMQPRPAHNINHYFGEVPTSEDCLYLNIWAPANSRGRAPVIVWIHGGGFVEGSPSMPFYHGTGLAHKGVVFVAISYRLGVLGFLSHPELTQESPRHASGNYGLMDQIAALRWVHKNIERLGGDPANVTVMGQSAGAFSVGALQVSPDAKGLFQRAAASSGAMFSELLAPPSLSEAERQGVELQNKLGVHSLAGLRQIPADKMLAAAPQGRPVLDGAVLPATPAEVFKRHQQVDVPLLIGFNSDEGFSPVAEANSLAEYHQALSKALGPQGEQALKLYPATNDQQAIQAARQFGRDSTVALQMNNWALAQIHDGSAPVYVYEFAHANPWGVVLFSETPKSPGAYHSADLPYWLGSVDALKVARPAFTWSAEDLQAADQMSTLLVNFASTGNPNGAGTPSWPAFTESEPKLMEFTNAPRAVPWPNADKLPQLRKLTPKS
jgi:para-nitrobenzyl esterase